MLSSGLIDCDVVNTFIVKAEEDLKLLKAIKRYCDLNEDLLKEMNQNRSNDMVSLEKEIYKIFEKEIVFQKHPDLRSVNGQLKNCGLKNRLQVIPGLTTINYVNVSDDKDDYKFLKKFVDQGFLTVNFFRTKTYQYEEIMKDKRVLNKNEFSVNLEGSMGSSLDESIGLCNKGDLKNAYASIIIVNSNIEEVEHLEYLNLKRVYIRFIDRGTCKSNF